MTKSIDEVYGERNLLACAFAVAIDAYAGWCEAPDTTDPEGKWALVFIEQPDPFGQVTFHVPRSMAERFGPPRREDGYSYDGHSTEEKIERLEAWAEAHQDD